MQRKKLIKVLTILSVVGSTSLVAAEETVGKSQFPQVDLNGDNQISKAELTAHAKAKAKIQFYSADTNGDGALSLDELIAQRAGKGYPRLQKMIDKVDANSDGLVDFSEFQATQERFGDLRGKIFNKLDANNDNQLNAEEFASIKKRDDKDKIREKVQNKIREKVRNKIREKLQSSDIGNTQN